jgi:hypothetical protein
VQEGGCCATLWRLELLIQLWGFVGVEIDSARRVVQLGEKGARGRKGNTVEKSLRLIMTRLQCH